MKRPLGNAASCLTCLGFWAAVAGGMVATGIVSAAAQTVSGTVKFEIARLPVSRAVNELANAAGISVLIEGSGQAVEGNAISGTMTVDAALSALLSGTGASYRFTGPSSVVVTLPDTLAGQLPKTDGAGGVTLGTIVISAGGFAQTLADAPASITVVPAEEIEKRGYTSLQDAVRDVEGVTVSGGVKGDISIRGMPADGTLILIDGRRQSDTRNLNPKGGNAVDDNWIPPIGAIEQIEVIRGPMGSRYGSDAMGGVINIITRKAASEWSGTIGTEATLPTSGNEGDGHQLDVYLSGPLVRDRMGLQFWGYVGDRDEDRIPGGQNDFSQANGTLRLWYTPNENHDLMLEFQRHSQDYRESVGLSAASTAIADTERDYLRESVTLAHSGRWALGTSELSFSMDESRRKAFSVDPATGIAVEDSWSPRIHNYTLEGSMVMPLGESHTLSFGAAWQREKLLLGGQRLGDGSTGVVEADVDQWSIFLEDEWRVVDGFNLTIGLRYDDNDIFGDHVSPRIYGTWHIDDAWTLKAGVATGFKAPSMRQYNPDFGNPQRGGATTWGNPELSPETSINKEIGLYFDDGGPFSGNITLFHNDYRDKIADTGSRCLTAPPGEPVNAGCWTGADGNPMSVYFNVPEAVMRGVELAGRWEINPSWSLSGNWTFVDSKMHTPGLSVYGFPLDQADGLAAVSTPRHVASLRLDWQVHDDLSSFARINYRGEDNRGINWGGGSTPMAESKGDLLTFDTGGSWQISDDATLNFAALNLLDKRVYDPNVTTHYQYIEEGRRFWIGLRNNF